MTSFLTNWGLPAIALGAVGGAVRYYRSRTPAAPANPTSAATESVFKKYGRPVLVVGAAGTIVYYGYTTPALATIGGVFCAYKAAEWLGLTKKPETTLFERIFAAYKAFRNPKIPASLEGAALLTAEYEKRKEIEEQEEKEKALKEQIKAGKKELTEFGPLRWELNKDVIGKHPAVQKVLDRRTVAAKASSVKGSKGKSVDVDDLAAQYLVGLKRKKYCNNEWGSIREDWNPQIAAADTLEKLKKSVDKGEMTKAEKEVVWKAIKADDDFSDL